jgi:hypothetical protein
MNNYITLFPISLLQYWELISIITTKILGISSQKFEAVSFYLRFPKLTFILVNTLYIFIYVVKSHSEIPVSQNVQL